MSDDPEDPELEHLFALARDALTAELHTCQPGSITSYDSATQTASVQLLLKTRHLDETDAEVSVPVPELHDVIVMHSGPGKNRITWPVKVGDVVLVHFCEASISTFKVKGGMVDDGDPRRHDLNDAIAVLAPHSRNAPPTDAPTDAIVHHADTGIKIKLGASSGTETTVKGDTFLGALNTFCAALQAYILGIETIADPLPGHPVTTTFNAAVAAFSGAIATYKTTVVEVK